VYFIAPRDGAKIHGSVTVQFGLKGMGVAPAGIKFDKPLPASDHVVHFGKGQTETTLDFRRASTRSNSFSRTFSTWHSIRRCARRRSR
jgi:hypothetical protein